jgi:polyisoprenoid-binding protein YceI
MKSLFRFASFAVALGASAVHASAAPLAFDFKDPKGVNNVQFSLDAPLEAISGTATGISGQITFDPENPVATTGRIVLATSSLTVGNPTMREHLHGGNWMDVAKFPEIVFESVSLSNVRRSGDRTDADLSGRITIKGVTKEITVPVSFTYLPGRLGARVNKPELKGDLLVVRANFEINRDDFGINPGRMADRVAEKISLSLSIAGAAPRE